MTIKLIITSLLYSSAFFTSAQTLQPRIIGGSNTTPEKHPSYVFLDVDGGVCGGTLIAKNWVLTAAHCLEESGIPLLAQKIKVGIMPTGITDRTIYAKETVVADSIYLHNGYDFPKNDIALIKLSRNVLMPYALLGDSSSALVGTAATVVGMGSITRQSSDSEDIINKLPEKLQEAQIPINHLTTCRDFYGVIPNGIICAGFTANNTPDACVGDSGGPLFTQQNGKKVQSGLVSFGNGCGVGGPGGFTDISEFKDFILKYAPDARFTNSPKTISNVSGVWYDPRKAGVGFTVMQSENVLSSLYYGYRNNGSPQWLITSSLHEGAVIKNKTFNLQLETSAANNGSSFANAPATTNNGTTPWGTVAFTFTGCNSATATLNGRDGSVTYQLVKLQNPKSFTCSE